MTSDQFTYWLQGFVEMNNGNMPNSWQWQMIKDHLQLCFNKVTPPYQQPPYKIASYTGAGIGGGEFPQYVYSAKVDKPTGGGGGC